MRILFVNHTFPPDSYAGSELCVLNLAQELKKQGHVPHVFYRYSNMEDEELWIREGEIEGISYSKINHTYRYIQSFQDIYLYPALAAKFGYLLRTFKPDIVHFHHLTNLSLSLVKEVKDYRCPVIMTLHDYWLLCQRGQLLKPDMSLCHGPSHSACRSCLGVQLLKGNAQRTVQWLWKSIQKQSKAVPQIRLVDQKPAEVQTANNDFFSKTSFTIDGKSSPTLQEHPPTSILFNVAGISKGILKTAYAMHPSTYEQEGAGVTFRIEINGSDKFTATINPKINKDQRGWHPVEIPIELDGKNNCEILLQTEPENPGDNQHCTAGWRDPVLSLQNLSVSSTPKAGFKSKLKPLAQWTAGTIAALSPQANEGIHHRRNWVQRVFDDVDLFISPSKFLRNFFIQHGMPQEKIIFSDNGFKLPTTQSNHPPHSPIRFGYIGTWIPSKGVDIALKAFQDIDPEKAQFIIHGFFPGYDGFERYEDELKTLAGPCVQFKGKYDPKDVYEILNDLDCLIMPSIWWENSPLTIHEAFAVNVPVITADVGGMAEQVNQGGGRTFKHRDPTSLKNVIREIIGNPTILSDMKNTIPAVKSTASFTEEFVELYQKLIANHDKSLPI